MQNRPELVPLLVVRDAPAAIDFYVRALGAQVITRFEHGRQRHVSHADLVLADARFSLTEEVRAFDSLAPPALGGSPVVLQLTVADARSVVAAMIDAGATSVFPIQELLGERMTRVRDPFGHVWLLHQPLRQLSTEQLQRERDELFARHEEVLRLNDSPAALQAPPHHGVIHLVIGPVGSGKSTLALELGREHRALLLTLDQWMTELFRPDRPDSGVMDWCVERAARCVEQIWRVAHGALTLGSDVVLEIGLLRRAERESFHRRVEAAGFRATTYVVDAARSVRRERVLSRNQLQGDTFSMVVPPEIFELASDLWEPPTDSECEGRDVRFIRTDAPPLERSTDQSTRPWRK